MYASVLGEIWPKNNFFNPCKNICLIHVPTFFFVYFEEFVDPSRRFGHCLAPNRVFRSGFVVAWHQTVFCTMFFGTAWCPSCIFLTPFAGVDAQSLHKIARVMAGGCLFLQKSMTKVVPPWSGRKNVPTHIQTYTFYYCLESVFCVFKQRFLLKNSLQTSEGSKK